MGWERIALKTLLAAPEPVLHALSGEGARRIDGRTLDPQMQLLDAVVRLRPGIDLGDLPRARRDYARAEALNASPIEPGASVEALTVPGAAEDLAARLHRPGAQDPAAPLLVWFHGGGGVLGGVEHGPPGCATIAQGARGPVLAIDYRLAPEHPFPAGLADAVATFRWARDHAARFGAPAGRAAVGGDSMGGNLAAAVCQALRAAGEAQPVLQLLVYPLVDVASSAQSMRDYADMFPFRAGLLDAILRLYAGPDANVEDPRLSPLRAADLAGLAPAIVATAGFDPLVDQGEAYAHRLLEAGVPTLYRCYDALCHGFLNIDGVVDAADVATREIAGLLRQGYEGMLPAAAALSHL